jgi:hypothetical protein
MKKFLCLLVLLFATLFAPRAAAQQCNGGVCVEEADLKTFVQLAKDQKCRQETAPKLAFDSVTIVVDKEGRIYNSGAEPLPYKFHMEWCNYTLEGTGKVSLVAAQHIDREWGFRFRPKFGAGLLALEAAQQPKVTDGVDVAFMADFVYFKQLNLNASLGVRSVGVSVGADISKNFGAFAGYGLTWGSWRHNPTVGLYFSF